MDAALYALRRHFRGPQPERHAARAAGRRPDRRRCAHARLRAVARIEARVKLRVAIPDLISPSYFPAIAAVELGFLDGTLELIYPVTRTYQELRDGTVDFVG